jgi:A/G-specific adenine glycosylase
VIDEWAGLGYNRRAVNLHRASLAMVEAHGGRVPTALDDLLALPGVGPYTARAVRAFALELDDGLVDTNIGRVLARIVGESLTTASAQRLADTLVPVGEGWAWNQAIMELGALVCRPNPGCERCPLTGACSWRRAGRPEPDPAVGSAAVAKGQSRFDGSDRQGRGRLVAALRHGPVAVAELADVMGWPGDTHRAARVAATLGGDGLAGGAGADLRLP